MKLQIKNKRKENIKTENKTNKEQKKEIEETPPPAGPWPSRPSGQPGRPSWCLQHPLGRPNPSVTPTPPHRSPRPPTHSSLPPDWIGVERPRPHRRTVAATSSTPPRGPPRRTSLPCLPLVCFPHLSIPIWIGKGNEPGAPCRLGPRRSTPTSVPSLAATARLLVARPSSTSSPNGLNDPAA